MQNVNVMKQVTGLIFLLQESQAFNTIFNSLNDFSHRLGPKHLPFASKISLKEQFFLELYNYTFQPVLNMQHSPWRSCYGQKVQLLDTGYTKQYKILSNHRIYWCYSNVFITHQHSQIILFLF